MAELRTRRSTARRGRGGGSAVMLVAVLLTVADCSGSDDQAGSEDEPGTEAAAAATQVGIDQGDSLGECPFGTPREIVDALPEGLPVSDSMGFSTDDGQVFSGGDVDIAYCELARLDDNDTDVYAYLRLDAAPDGEVDLDTYLDEEFVDPGDTTIEEIDGYGGGDLRRGCWDDGRTCGVSWQGKDLFVSVVALADGQVVPEDVTAMSEPSSR